jgi:hypothetical protein
VLAGAFAFVFYLFAAQLYQAGMSRRTYGVVVAAAGSPDALFLGMTELFFPRGGNHPLEIPNAESLEAAAEPDGPYGARGGNAESLTTVDTGVVSAPDYRVSNLAFRNVIFVQPVSLECVTESLRRDADGAITVTVRNGTGQDLDSAVVIVPGEGLFMPLETLKAGATARVDGMRPSHIVGRAARGIPREAHASRVKPGQVPQDPAATDLAARSSLARNLFALNGSRPEVPGAFLVAETSGAPYGPRMGSYVPGMRVGVLVSLPVTRGGA